MRTRTRLATAAAPAAAVAVGAPARSGPATPGSSTDAVVLLDAFAAPRHVLMTSTLVHEETLDRPLLRTVWSVRSTTS